VKREGCARVSCRADALGCSPFIPALRHAGLVFRMAQLVFFPSESRRPGPRCKSIALKPATARVFATCVPVVLFFFFQLCVSTSALAATSARIVDAAVDHGGRGDARLSALPGRQSSQ
jgi:hypothetical protein